jgi:hypothetical protein
MKQQSINSVIKRQVADSTKAVKLYNHGFSVPVPVKTYLYLKMEYDLNTVQMLRGMLKSRRISCTGLTRKADLIDRLIQDDTEAQLSKKASPSKIYYAKNTVVELRQLLKQRSIPFTGLNRKANMIARLEEDDARHLSVLQLKHRASSNVKSVSASLAKALASTAPTSPLSSHLAKKASVPKTLVRKAPSPSPKKSKTYRQKAQLEARREQKEDRRQWIELVKDEVWVAAKRCISSRLRMPSATGAQVNDERVESESDDDFKTALASVDDFEDALTSFTSGEYDGDVEMVEWNEVQSAPFLSLAQLPPLPNDDQSDGDFMAKDAESMTYENELDYPGADQDLEFDIEMLRWEAAAEDAAECRPYKSKVSAQGYRFGGKRGLQAMVRINEPLQDSIHKWDDGWIKPLAKGQRIMMAHMGYQPGDRLGARGRNYSSHPEPVFYFKQVGLGYSGPVMGFWRRAYFQGPYLWRDAA